jgi:valyl-tRNA synthetase
MATVYGVFSGEAKVTEAQPLACNTSSRFDAGRNFATKLWNAVRFALGRVTEPSGPNAEIEYSEIDRWMLSRVATTTVNIDSALGQCQFAVCADLLYDLIWRDLCDWYLEAVKHTVSERPDQQQVLLTVLDAVLRLLHPVCPFVTETAWAAVRAKGPSGVPGLQLGGGDLLALAHWPAPADHLRDPGLEDAVTLQRQLINAVRRVRTERQLPGKLRPVLLLESALFDAVSGSADVLCAMGRLDRIERMDGTMPEGAAPVATDGGIACLAELGEAAGISEAVNAQRIEELQRTVQALSGRLNNAGYVDKAPPALVDETRQHLAQATAELKELQE